MSAIDDPARRKTSRRMIGLVFLVLLSLLVWLSVAIYQKTFTDSAVVTLRTSSLGNEMHPNADVKMRGVVIGSVREISADGNGARLTLAMQPGQLDRVPANVSAMMLPTTLFGQRYVALVPPPQADTRPLEAGMTITEDRSASAVELQQVLNNSLPLLTAIQPAKLSATLNALSRALQGRGDQLGQNLVQFEQYLEKTNPTLPTLNRDIRELVRVAHTYADAAPDILQALTDFTTTSRTLVERRSDLSDLYRTVTGSARDINAFLRANEENIVRLNATGRPSLEVLARYAPEFPCTLRMLAEFVPVVDKALGKGTDEPGLHVAVKTVPAPGRYVPGRDRVRFNAADIGPHCYTLPYRGVTDDSRLGNAQSVGPAPATQAGLGLPNSTGENRLINELVGGSLGVPAQTLPDWSSVLVGGLYRGKEVTLK
jgi:phospholipid/cholesterol/gamma-HCH transport system substrate-binding protein